ncbi:hypothetical protein NBRC3188_3333 [Acetobacter pasteurianus NBRC 3188]|uniref:Uncharacterized protein n=1 Tax=Acetobacter pasteurianus NBRC 3188 TaxID=1226663 RepID=A0A401WZA2_ACEPA|nr:hypothetical protein NBRC3188_3333 [Acetobacter pasteurianus NBRC 3188]
MQLGLVGLAERAVRSGLAQFKESDIEVIQQLCGRHKNLLWMTVDAALRIAIGGQPY